MIKNLTGFSVTFPTLVSFLIGKPNDATIYQANLPSTKFFVISFGTIERSVYICYEIFRN